MMVLAKARLQKLRQNESTSQGTWPSQEVFVRHHPTIDPREITRGNIYIYMCVCVCIDLFTHIYIYIYIIGILWYIYSD